MVADSAQSNLPSLFANVHTCPPLLAVRMAVIIVELGHVLSFEHSGF
jgi:hypothetical protein